MQSVKAHFLRKNMPKPKTLKSNCVIVICEYVGRGSGCWFLILFARTSIYSSMACPLIFEGLTILFKVAYCFYEC